VKSLVEEFLSTLFPSPCPLCRAVILEKKEGFCPACVASFEVIQEPVCFCCGHPLQGALGPEPFLCHGCLLRDALLPEVRSIVLYSGSVRKAILRVKYGRQAAVALGLGIFLRDHHSRVFPDEVFDRIVPVPLHPERLREREFSQCVLMARPLAAHLKIPLDLDAVERIRHTMPQSASSEAERRKNLRGAFRVRKPERINRRSILLLDDVYTTGATLEALACSVQSAGARRVAALTLARSPRPGHFMNNA
jgi:ComF family protein